jgi:hypothetical protein
MAVLPAYPRDQYSGGVQPFAVNLSTAQTGNGASTNVADRGGTALQPGLLVITSTIGATPGVLVDIQGSIDNVTFWNIPYADFATPETVSVAQLAQITTATTLRKYLRPGHPWRYLRTFYSSNTNVTLSVDAYFF